MKAWPWICWPRVLCSTTELHSGICSPFSGQHCSNCARLAFPVGIQSPYQAAGSEGPISSHKQSCYTLSMCVTTITQVWKRLPLRAKAVWRLKGVSWLPVGDGCLFLFPGARSSPEYGPLSFHFPWKSQVPSLSHYKSCLIVGTIFLAQVGSNVTELPNGVHSRWGPFAGISHPTHQFTPHLPRPSRICKHKTTSRGVIQW